MLRKLMIGAAALALIAGIADAAENEYITGNLTVGGTISGSGASTTTSASANCLTAGPNGTTNPSFNVDCSAASAATGLNVAAAASGSGVAVSALGGTNEAVFVAGKGTGQVNIGGTTTTLAGLQVAQPASRVNGFVVTPGATTVVPTIAVGGAGADTNIGMAINGAGTGSVFLGGTTAANAAMSVAHGTTNVNQVIVTGTNTGTAPSITVGGSGADANRNLTIQAAGTGIVNLGQTACTATGTTPQTCNGQKGVVTTGTLTTAAATDASFVINNSSVSTSSVVNCQNQGYSGTLVTNGYPIIVTCVPGSGTITAHITNTHSANALNGTVAIGFFVSN